ncbi:MAG: N-terminal phage integrase SAM-like domain-containing protein [Oscillospiraceae bacterium]|nr:N-terminal phage integrase SAM-like domain-containing protein [Oscillospiraceae bacterium]
MAAIEKRGKNSYRLTVSCGYDTFGKNIYKKKTITLDENLTEKKSKEELQRQFILFKKQVESGKLMDGENILFADFINHWLANYAEREFAPSTLHVYKMRLHKRVIPALGHLKLTQIKPMHLLEFYDDKPDDFWEGGDDNDV